LNQLGKRAGDGDGRHSALSQAIQVGDDDLHSRNDLPIDLDNALNCKAADQRP